MECSEFTPSDEELIVGFLKPFCNNKPMAMNIISEINLYNFTPDELAGRYPKLNSKEWFFFTPREKCQPGSKERASRSTKNGNWRRTGPSQDITVNGKVIGKKSRLVYYIRKNQKTNWFMYEYTYNDHDSPLHRRRNRKDMRLDKVLCKIHQSRGWKRRTDKKKEEDVGEAVVLELFDLDEEQQEQEQEQNLQKVPLNPSLDPHKDQEEDVGEAVLNCLI